MSQNMHPIAAAADGWLVWVDHDGEHFRGMAKAIGGSSLLIELKGGGRLLLNVASRDFVRLLIPQQTITRATTEPPAWWELAARIASIWDQVDQKPGDPAVKRMNDAVNALLAESQRSRPASWARGST